MSRSLLWFALSVLLLASGAACAEPTVYVAFYRGETLFVAERHTAEQPTPALAARLLLQGPTAEEAADGIRSAIPATAGLINAHVDDANQVHVDVTRGYLEGGLDDARLEDMGRQWFGTFRQFPFVAGVIITIEGRPLSEFIRPAEVKERSPGSDAPRPALQGAAGKKITISPGHGRYWTGSGWNYMRPQYCGHEEEDLRNLRMSIFLRRYLENHGAVVYMCRQNNLSYGNSPYDGNRPWWQMAASYWIKQAGYPCTVYANSSGDCVLGSGGSESSDDIRARALMSDYENTDIYISIHTNGLTGYCEGAGCPTGTETYYDAGEEHAPWGAVSQQLGNAVNPNIVSAINTAMPEISPDWGCHGTCVKNSNGAYGEIRIPDRAAILTELGFHDTCDRDAPLMNDNFFRSVAMWGMYKGVCEYFGDTPTPMYNSQYVSNDIPDTVTRGEIRTFHITFRNKGVLWSNARSFFLGAVGDSDPFALSTRQTVTGEVSVNDTCTFSLTMRFGAEGVQTTDWRMLREGVTWFGETFTKNVTVTPSTDVQAPTVPRNLRITGRRVAGVDLAWDACTDNVAVWGYRILRDGVEVGTTTATTYTDNGLTSGVTYEWRVEAFDVVPNYSGPSSPVSGSTCVPQNLRVTGVTYCTASLAWDLSSGAVGVTGYRVWRNGAIVGSTTGTTYADDLLDPDTDYAYQVDAYDSVPNYSTKSNAVVAHTDDQDLEPPTVPQNLRVTAVTRSTVGLKWEPSTDNVGMSGYRIWRNGAVISISASASYVDSNLDPGTAYSYEVDAFDVLLNYSEKSTPAAASTNAGGVFLEGFDGSMSNWILDQGTPFQYSTAQNHGVLTGAGSAYSSSGSGHLMYHWLDTSRQMATAGGYPTGILEGWLYDTQGAYSGMRAGLRLCAYDSSGTKKAEYWVGTYNLTGFPTFYMGAIWAGAWTYYNLGVVRSVAWHKLGIEVLPRTGSNDLRFHVDGAVRATLSQPVAAADTVLRQACIGYYQNVNADSYLDDISFDSAPPLAPSNLAATSITQNSIRWTFTDNANNELGFRLYDGATKIAEREVMNATYIDEIGLQANTSRTRTAKAYAGEVESVASTPVTFCTLSVPPSGSTIAADPAPSTWTSGALKFTSLAAFGVGGVQYYRYELDQSPVHSWTGTEQVWNGGTLELTPTDDGNNWYLHLRGYNACDVANGSYSIGPLYFDSELKAKHLADGAALKLSGKVVSAAYSGAFYIVELDRVSGIKVVSTTAVQIGDSVDVTGTMQTAGGERYIQATSVTVH